MSHTTNKKLECAEDESDAIIRIIKKIDKLVKIFNENKIMIVDNERIGNVAINAEFFLDEICNKLIEEGFSNYDITNLKSFLGDNLIMIKIDNILWISFEYCTFPLEALYETELFRI